MWPSRRINEVMVTQQVSLYNTGMKQLLMYLREKTLQERQQALFLEFYGKSITRLNFT